MSAAPGADAGAVQKLRESQTVAEVFSNAGAMATGGAASGAEGDARRYELGGNVFFWQVKARGQQHDAGRYLGFDHNGGTGKDDDPLMLWNFRVLFSCILLAKK